MTIREFNMRVDGRERNRRRDLEHSAQMVAYLVNHFPSFSKRGGRAKSVEDVIGMAPWRTRALRAQAKRKRKEAEEAEEQS